MPMVKAAIEAVRAAAARLWLWLDNENFLEVGKALAIGVILSAIDFAGLNSALSRESAAFNNALRVYYWDNVFIFDEPKASQPSQTHAVDPIQAVAIDEPGIKAVRSQFDWKGTVTDFKGYASMLDVLFAPDPADPKHETRPSSVFFDISFIGSNDAVFARSVRNRNAPDPIADIACANFDIRAPKTPDDHGDAACFLKRIREITKYELWRKRPECRDPISKITCIVAADGRPVFFATTLSDSDPSLFVQRLHEASVPVMVSLIDDDNTYPLIYERVLCGAQTQAGQSCKFVSSRRFRPGNVAEVVNTRQARAYDLSPGMAMWVADQALGEGALTGTANKQLGAMGLDIDVGTRELAETPALGASESSALAFYTTRLLWTRVRPALADRMFEASATVGALPTDRPKSELGCTSPEAQQLGQAGFLYRNLLRGIVDKERSIVPVVVDCSNVPTINIRNLFNAAAPFQGGTRAHHAPPRTDGELFVSAASRRHVVVGGALVSGDDWFATPLSQKTPGMYIHANAYLTIRAMAEKRLHPYRDLGKVGEVVAQACVYAVGLTIALLADRLVRYFIARLRTRMRGNRSLKIVEGAIYVVNWILVVLAVMVISLVASIAWNINGINTLEVMVVFATLPVVFKMVKKRAPENTANGRSA